MDAAARGFAAKTLASHFVASQVRVQNLQCDVSLQSRIKRFENDPHPSSSQNAHHIELRNATEVRRIAGWIKKIKSDIATSRPRSTGMNVSCTSSSSAWAARQ